jgi:hypothetical protein
VSGGFVFPETDAVGLEEASRRRLNRERRSTASRRMLWTTAWFMTDACSTDLTRDSAFRR